MSKILIQLQQISLEHEGTPILDPLDLILHQGEMLTLVGPNGAGKSSLLKVLLGLVPPSHGNRIVATGVTFGYVPQRFQVENTFPLTVAGFLTLQNLILEDSILMRLQVHKLLQRPLHRLSGGELQRVLLARALLRKPTVLVLDELDQGVDWASQEELQTILAQTREVMHCAVVLVSHDPFWVMAGTDRVICLNRHICCQGTPETISQHATFQAIFPFRRDPRVALYQHHHDHAHDWHGNITPGETL